MFHRLGLDIEFEAEACDAFFRPSPERRYTDAFENLRGLMHVVVSISFAVDIWSGLLHSRTMPTFFG